MTKTTWIRLPEEEVVTAFLDRLQRDDPLASMMMFSGDRWRHVTACACATVRDTVVGLATLAPCDELGSGGPHIIGVYVMPDHRRQGWGRTLLTELAEESILLYHKTATVYAVTPAGLAACRGIENLIVADQVSNLPTTIRFTDH